MKQVTKRYSRRQKKWIMQRFLSSECCRFGEGSILALILAHSIAAVSLFLSECKPPIGRYHRSTVSMRRTSLSGSTSSGTELSTSSRIASRWVRAGTLPNVPSIGVTKKNALKACCRRYTSLALMSHLPPFAVALLPRACFL